MARQGGARLGLAGQGKARRGKARSFDMARGIYLGSRSRVDPAGKLEHTLKRPSTRIRRHRGHRQGIGRKGRRY